MGLGDLVDVERSLDTTIFMVLALVGFGLLVVSYVLGETLDLAGDVGAEIGDGDFASGVVNLHTVSAFLAGFGSLGWLLSGYWGVDPLWSALGGVLGGVPLAGLVVAVGRMLDKQSGSSNFRLDELIGTEAVVTLGMAPGAVGYVEYQHAGGRHRTVARPQDDEVIPVGAIVQVTRVVGGELLVVLQRGGRGTQT